MDEFDPEDVPTVGLLLNELDHIPADVEGVAKVRRVEGESIAVPRDSQTTGGELTQGRL